MRRMLSLVILLASCGGSDVGDPPDAAEACNVNSDCDDGNNCTGDLCMGDGTCLNDGAAFEGEACDDGLACTTNGLCTAGACVEDPLDCGSLTDFCNTGVCDETAGGCVADPLADFTPCDDGLFCTDSDECQGGTCGGSPRDCATGAECVTGICDEASSTCSTTPTPDGGACDDGVFCTVTDSCTTGVCAGGPRDCSAVADACNVAVCDETTGACLAIPANEGGACDDGDFCTVNDTCAAGACGGAARDCSGAADACNLGTCDEITDACVPSPTNEGDPCDDGLYCTLTDVCTTGTCGGLARDCSSFTSPCNLGICDEAIDSCMAIPYDEAELCDDGLYCTVSEICTAGVCSGGSPRSCNDANVCTSDSCDETADVCVGTPAPIPGAEGPPGSPNCSDGADNDCDGAADSADPNCSGCVSAADCADGNACTTDVCTAGVCSNPSAPLNGTACNDGQYCTTTDVCSAGVCGGAARDCSAAGNACNAGACSESTDSCVPVPANEGAACTDALYCTVSEICAAGVCGGPPRDCSGAADQCNTGTCNETADACQSVPTNEGATCSDGFYCTTGDICASGTCSGPASDCSAAGNQCNAGTCNESADACQPTPLPNGTACDTLFCSVGETCTAGACAGGSPNCNDGSSCTTDSCNEAVDTCSNPARMINSMSATTSTSGCLVAGSGARAVVSVDLRDTLGVRISGGSVTIGGVAATESVASPGVYWREVTAGAGVGPVTLAVSATACSSTVALPSVTIAQPAANATNGGTGGCSPTGGNVRVKVVAAETGAVIAGAVVMVGLSEGTPFQHAPDALFGGASSTASNLAVTDAMGFASFYDYGMLLAGQVTVTAGATSRAYFTVADGSASDLVLALPLLNPAAPVTAAFTNGSGSSTSTWPPTGCGDIDMGVALPRMNLDQFSSFDITSLFGKNRCWDSMNGNIGTVAVPENVYLPVQSIGPLCFGGSVAAAPWRLDLVNPSTEDLELVMASAPYGDVQTALGPGGSLFDLLGVLTYRRIGFDTNVSVTGPVSGTNIVENETYPNNYTVTYSGKPTETDIIGFTIGDYAGTNGTGPLFMLGSDVHEWNVGGSTVVIPNSDLNATGGGVEMPAGVRRLAVITAAYNKPADHPTIAANRINASTSVHIRGASSGMAPFGATGGTGTVTNMLGLAGTTFTAPGTFSWENATANGNSPLYSVHQLSLRTNRYLPVLSCETDNEVREERRTQWIVVKPFQTNCLPNECFTLPTLPATFPRAAASVQQKSGFEAAAGSGAVCTMTSSCQVGIGESCVDPDGAAGAAGQMCMTGAGTAASPYSTSSYEWILHGYDLELFTGTWNFNAWQFADRRLYLTHETTNSAPFN